MNIPIPTPAVSDFVFRAADRMRIDGCANAIAREGLNLALFCPFEALLDHYTGLLLQRIRQQAPEHSIEVYFPANTDSLLGRFNEVLSQQSVQQATRLPAATEHTQIWLVHDAQKLPESEIQLLARLIQNFPGANIRAILLMSGHEAAKMPLPAFGRKILRWDIEVPTEEQAQAALEQAQHSGHFTAVHQLLQRIQRKPLAAGALTASAESHTAPQSNTIPGQQAAKTRTAVQRLHTFHQHGAKGLQNLRKSIQSLGKTPRFLRQHAKLSLAIAAALIASTLFMLWLQPEAFGLNSLKSKPPMPKAQVSSPPAFVLPTPAASGPATPESQAPKAAALPPAARPASELTSTAEPSIEAPDAAIQAQTWIRGMDPNSFLIQYGTSTTYEKGLDLLRKFPELKQSRIVAAYRPGEKLAHFVIVSGPYNPVTQAYDAAKRPGLPSGSWVRSTRNLQDQLKAPTPPPGQSAMKKGTILRNDAPHAVKMPEGSKVAARKVKKVTTTVPVPEEVVPAPAARKSVSPKAKTTKDKPAPAKVATKPRAKPRAKPQTPEVSAPVQAISSKATESVTAPRILPAPLDEAAIWEKDNPVKARMNQLKARNALLEEQLQRLQSPFQARGRKP